MDDERFEAGLQEIRADRTRGARQLAVRCLEILTASAQELPAADVVELRAVLQERAAALAAARPSMTPIETLLARWGDALAALPGELPAARARAVAAARELAAGSEQALAQLAEHAARWLGPNKTLLTHSLSSSVVEVCRRLRGQGLRMIVTESRPLGEGQRLAATLSQWQVPTSYITEAQIGLFVAEADAVLVGADSVLANGDVINKAGTYLLALAARAQGIPFYVCCESFKRRARPGAPALEEMDAAELGVPGWPGVSLRNVYFDRTPAGLISAWISEAGVATRP